MPTPGARLKAVRERSGFSTAKEAAQAMNIAVATYTHHEKATHHLPARRAAEYARFFNTTPEYLLYGRDDAVSDRVPIVDIDGTLTTKTAGLPPAPSNLTRAQLIDGGFLGFVAVYDEPQTTKPPPDLDGRLCVISLRINGAETRILRIINYGSQPDTYHLISPTATTPPLFDHKIVWAAPVTALVPMPETT